MTAAPLDRPPEPLNQRIKVANMSVDPNVSVIHADNEEEETYDSKIANFSKGLRHDSNTGEVIPDDYETFLEAVKDSLANTPDYENAIANFETVPVGTSITGPIRKFVNPVCGLSYDSEGLDSFNREILEHPKLNSLDAAAEMAELYWMAIMRDTNFTDYDESHTMAKDAIDDLNTHFSSYPYWTLDKIPITAKTLFRGLSLGNAHGPYISQFLYRGNKNVTLDDLKEEDGLVAYGTQHIDQRCLVAKEELDFMTDFPNWLKVQDGANTGINRFDDRFSDVADNPERLSDENNRFFNKKTRFIKNLRDLATYVHFDALYQAYFVACAYMLSAGFPFSDGLPYKANIKSQEGFGNYGGPHILSLLTEVATRALKAVWFQKWYVYRRLRPEAFGWLIHQTKTNGTYDIHSSIINNSAVLPKIFEHNKKLNDRFKDRKDGGTYLLPQAFREGSPLHPSYGAGHATVAGACVTILKAWFKDFKPVPENIWKTIWEANHDGSELKEYKGNDKDEITVHGELNKLASNIAIGRNAGGVHYRTDYTASLTLGEEVAISILREIIMYLPEKSTKFHFKRFFTKPTDPEFMIP